MGQLPDDGHWLQVEIFPAGSYGAQMVRVGELLSGAPEFQKWWTATGIASLRLAVITEDDWPEPVPRAGARKSGHDLVVTFLTQRSSLPARSDQNGLRRRAVDDVYGVLTSTALKRKWVAPPPLPAFIFDT